MHYDIIVIGSGPGGYVAAIRAAQLGLKTALVEKSELGGICLNWGCIPTKALLKSANILEYTKNSNSYGIIIEGTIKPDFEAIIKRSRNVAETMSKGVSFLLKKNKIDVIKGIAKLEKNKTVSVKNENNEILNYTANHTIIATGASSTNLPFMKQDGKKIIGYREALTLTSIPSSMVVVGSGAIGSEFAYFYNNMGTKVTIVEYMPNILPVEDSDVSVQLERSFKKIGITVKTNSKVTSIDTSSELSKVFIETPKGQEILEAEVVLSAVGITPNIENIGLEELGINTENNKIQVDKYYKTNIEGIYAIGDVVPGPALAHVASHEAIVCVEKIAGLNPDTIDYKNIPYCTYTNPEVASVGLTEKQAKDAGYEIKVGKFPLTASGKAQASGKKDGFVKVIFDAKYGEWLGAHMIGENVTEMIATIVAARKLETTAHEIINSVFPHPTISEAIMEAVAAAYNEAIHL